MASRASYWLMEILLLLAAYVSLVEGYVLFAFLFIVLAVFYFAVRLLAPALPKAPKAKGEGAAAKPRQQPPPYGQMQEHISRHTYGVGESLHNLGRALVWMLGGMKFDRRKHDESHVVVHEDRRKDGGS